MEPRLGVPRWLRRISPLLSILVALVIGAAILQAAGVEPLEAYAAIFRAAFFGGAYALSDTAVKATPLIFTGLACALAFHARLWNIGAEGQLFLGAWAATGMATFWLPTELSAPARLTIMALAAFAAGAAWAFIPGILKARFRVNEIITSLMLVYVAQHWNNYWVYGPWSDSGFQLTPMFSRSAWLPRLADLAESNECFAGLTVHLGLLIGVMAAFVIWWAVTRTTWGFKLRIMGDAPEAARYAGIAVNRQMVLVMLISGGLAGLAGMSEVAGVVHRLQERFSPGYGFTAIIIAFLAKKHPLMVVLVAFLFGGLLVGAKAVQPAGIPLMLQGVILFVVVGFDVLITYRPRLIVTRSHRREVAS
ncbi:ABC transporter permease [bacterium]|nr:ABC transporter permease [candidate division CSSED10-310 bacterium]